MRTRIAPAIGIAVLATLLMAGTAARAGAEEACSDASLSGSYAFKVDGTNVSNPSLPLGPFAAVGKNTYDGKGHMQGTIVVSANGLVFSAVYSGVYAVNANCTGTKSATLSIGATVQFDFVVDNNFRELQMIVTRAGPASSLVDGLTVTGTARKLFSGGGGKH